MRKIIEAAGGILWRVRHDVPADGTVDIADPMERIEVCVVHRPKYDDWSWPKGKVDPGESHRHAAVREIGEETGASVALGPYLGEVEYPLDQEGCKTRRSKDRDCPVKHVTYWMARPIDQADALRRSEAFGPVHKADVGEIDRIEWLPVPAARHRLTHSDDRDILALFADRVEEGAQAAVPVLLVRHGKAEPRKTWRGTDSNRPVTPLGAAASYALSCELACYNPTRLETSPWLRCRQTLQMMAWQTGLTLTELEPLTEDAFADDPDGAWQCLSERIEAALSSGQATAICMHRPVIGGMFEHLRTLAASKTLAKRLPSKTPYMPCGTAVALFMIDTANGPRIIDIQKVTPLVH